jgi:invasion protein IalB
MKTPVNSRFAIRLIPAAAFALIVGMMPPATAQTQQRAPAAAPAAKPAAAPAAKPAEPKELGQFDAWTAVEWAQAQNKTCYMFAAPAASEPKGAKRDDIMLLVTHRPAAKQQDEVSLQVGYSLKPGAPVSVEIDGKKFAFFSNAAVDEGTAWLQDPAGDKAIVAALRAGKSVKARATSTRGTDTTDTFSLVGFAKAYAEIGKACNVK